MQMLLARILFPLWTLLIFSLPFDNFLSFEIDRYTIRFSYFLFAILGAIVLSTSILDKKFKETFGGRELLPWFLMLVAGAISIRYSQVPRRSMLYLIWTAISLFTIPRVIPVIINKLGTRSLLIVVFCGVLHALVVIIDAALCIPSEGKLHIGSIQVYDYIIKTGMHLCRPSAGYQEPSYFAMFTLLIVFLLRELHKKSEKKSFLLTWAYRVFLLALFLCTSRLGWLGILYFLCLDLYDFLQSSGFSVKKFSYYFYRSLLPVSMIFCFAFIFLKSPVIYNYLIYDMIGPKLDGGMNARARNLRASLEVFREHPLVGVGPGAASAYHIDIVTPRTYAHLTPEFREHWRNSPLAQNLYTELLSEWGIIGFIGFFIGFYLLLLRIPLNTTRLQFALLLAIILTASQTVAKLDFWVLVVAIIAAIPNLYKGPIDV